ncbi:MAG TPA: hypothetical protein V6C57_07955 [Coleofasciculaceae cyanobacterium]
MTYLLMPQMTHLFAWWYPFPSKLPVKQPHATPFAIEPSADFFLHHATCAS